MPILHTRGVTDPGIIEGHVDNLVFHPGIAGFIGIGEMEDMGAAVAGMTSLGLTVAVFF